MDVRGVPREQDTPVAVPGHLAGGVAEGADPHRLAVRDVDAGQPLPGRRDLLVRRCLGAPLRGRAPLADDQAGDAAGQMTDHHHAAGQGLADHARFEIEAPHVGEVHLQCGSGPGEVETHRLADLAASAVAADEVLGAQLVHAVRATHLHERAVAVVLDGEHLVAAADVRAEVGDPLLQHGLGVGLRHGLGRLVGAVENAEVDGQATEVSEVADLDLAEPGEQPALGEHLHRPRGESQSARLTRAFGQSLQKDDLHSGEPQFMRRASVLRDRLPRL